MDDIDLDNLTCLIDTRRARKRLPDSYDHTQADLTATLCDTAYDDDMPLDVVAFMSRFA